MLIRFGLSIRLASNGREWIEREFINGFCFMLPVEPFNVAACGEPGVYAGGRADGYGVLPDRARILPVNALVRLQFFGACELPLWRRNRPFAIARSEEHSNHQAIGLPLPDRPMGVCHAESPTGVPLRAIWDSHGTVSTRAKNTSFHCTRLRSAAISKN